MIAAVIFDIDGTIADLSDRLHYLDKGDWKSFFAEVGNDKPITKVIELTRLFEDLHYEIILVSGRCSSTRDNTREWLEKYQVSYDHLFMRTEGDYRADHIVKEEILREIQENYSIDYVFDDRQSVVDMWRRNGLTCFQCAAYKPEAKGKLTLMVGPSGAGKTTFLAKEKSYKIVSSDDLREEICGDRADQSQNAKVLDALHKLVESRIHAGLDTIVDATNLKRKDRLYIVNLSNGGPVEYIVIDRPLEDKLRDRGWRPEWLIKKHDERFRSNLKDILRGDNLSNVAVKDFRNEAS